MGPGETRKLFLFFPYWRDSLPKFADFEAKIPFAGPLNPKSPLALAAYIPWAQFESDNGRRLQSFVEECAQRGIEIHLFPVPDATSGVKHAGYPQEILDQRVWARTEGGKSIPATLPPKFFPWPSPHHEGLSTRYCAWLTRLQRALNEIESPKVDLRSVLRMGIGGGAQSYFPEFTDESHASREAYAKWRAEYLSSAEFKGAKMHWSKSAFSSLSFEPVLKSLFQGSGQESFRNRTLFGLRRGKLWESQLSQWDIVTPELDPEIVKEQALMWSDVRSAFSEAPVQIGHPELFRKCMERVKVRVRNKLSVEDKILPPMIKLSSFGSDSKYNEAERAYFALWSLIQAGSRKGALGLDYSQWQAFPEKMTRRLLGLAEAFRRLEIHTPQKAYGIVAKPVYSDEAPFWKSMQKEYPGLSFSQSISAVCAEKETQVLILEPARILDSKDYIKLISWIEAGGILIASQNQIVSPAAEEGWATLLRQWNSSPKMEFAFNAKSKLAKVGKGRVLLMESNFLHEEDAYLARGICALANLPESLYCEDRTVEFIPFEFRSDGFDWTGLWVHHPFKGATHAEIEFQDMHWFADLGACLRGEETAPSWSASAERKFALDLPAYGILPLGYWKRPRRSLPLSNPYLKDGFNSEGVQDGPLL